MKYRIIFGLFSILLFVFGMPAPLTQAEDKTTTIPSRFRLLFNAYDGDPKKDAPEKFVFQINTIDLKQPSEFLKLGEKITNTKWKLAKFEYKTRLNPITEELEDVSELIVVNTETQQEVVLILMSTTDMSATAPKK